MKITLYSTGCPKCQVLEKKLNLKNLSYETITDESIIFKIAEEIGLQSLPILHVNNDYMDFSKAIKWVGEQ